MIVGLSTAPRGQVMNETLGQLAAGPRVLARTESSRTQSGDETGWTTARSLGEVGTTSVRSKPVFACDDCTFLDEIHRAVLEKKRAPPAAAIQGMLAVSRTRGRHAKKPNIVSIRFLRQIARLGKHARAAKLSQRALSKIGGHAATVRWSQVKAPIAEPVEQNA